MEKSRFDEAAATWDEQPARVLMARNIARAILAQVPVNPSMTALDYGCGTGLVTLALQPDVGRIIGVDSSSGMLAQLKAKVQSAGITHVQTRLLDLTAGPPPEDLRADLIVSAMALHHIEDIPRLLDALGGMLAPQGYLALADLDTEDGSFHADKRAVHHFGIDREWLASQLARRGYQDVKAATAHEVERPDSSGQMRRYPVFLVSGRKPA